MIKISLVLLALLTTHNSYAMSSKSVKNEKNKAAIPKVNHSLATTSPFLKGLNKVLNSNKNISKASVVKAFEFLDQNYQGLQKDKLCFAKTNSKNKDRIRNLNCMVVADYSKSKTAPRLLYINPKTGDHELFLTAHGKGSNRPEERETGLSTVRYSNVSGSNMTSLGFYLTDFLITSKKNTFGPGPNNGLMLDGISCTNTNARMRQIVAHTAMYVPNIEEGTSPKVGNSEGCITLPSTRKDVLKACEHGALVFAYDNMNKHLNTYQKK